MIRAVIHAFELAQEDVHKWTDGLNQADLYASTLGLTPIAFHLRHIPRTLDRLLTYAEGHQLSPEQLAAKKREFDPGLSRDALLEEFDSGLASATKRVRALASADLNATRSVGRNRLPASLGGLIVHLADHTQRHTGQIVTTAKAVKAAR